MATKTGANLLDSILQSTGVTLNALLTATLTAKLQQMIDNGTDSDLAVSIAVSGFSTDINDATVVPDLSDTVATNSALIEAAADGEVISFPPYDGAVPDPGDQVFTFTSNAAAVYEGSPLTFTVTAANPVTEDTVVTYEVIPADSSGDATLDVGTTGTNLNDFAEGSLTGTVTMRAGATTASFTVTPVNDLGTELSESFSVTATVNGESFSLDATVLDGDANSPLILDDDGSTMRLTGNQDVRIDFTDSDNQITGLDIDYDGTIEADGVENAVDVMPASDFTIVDAYARNLLNHNDSINNFLGDIAFDGTGFDGDGVSTNGNIFLGGLGADSAAGGIGNDFMTGGGVADPTTGEDYLFGGRNADFFFTSLSALDFVDGDSQDIDGGETADDTAGGMTESSQDTDWLLFEASDDDEPVSINLGSATEAGTIRTEFQQDDGGDIDVGDANDGIDIINLENVDASGNLYGFLDDIDVALGENGMVVDGENVGIGTTAQLVITGNDSINRIIGGFDNDWIDGQGGDDLLMGGNLDYNNNPNTQNIVNDGTDELIGGEGNDHLVFELDNGIYEGGAVIGVDDAGNEGMETDDSGKALDQIVQDTSYDTLWLTDNLAGTSTVNEMTTDNTVRLDLAVGKVGGLTNSSGYGGADENFIDAGDIAQYTADQTNYVNEGDRTQVQDIENVNATGLGDVDYLAAGTNDPELTFNNQQNLEGLGDENLEDPSLEDADLDLRGTYRTEAEDGNNHLYASDGNDVLEGRTGDDKLMGGEGDDDFIFDLGYVDNVAGTDGDGENIIHRLDDTDGDNIWDGTYSRDFLLGGSTQVESSGLNIQISNNDDTLEVGIISFYLEGEQFVINGSELADQADMGSIVDYMNAQLPGLLVDSGLTGIASVEASLAAGTDTGDTEGSFTITAKADADATEAPRFTEAGDTFDPDSVEVFINTSDSGAASTATENPGGIEESGDRLIFAAYEDRADGELVDDDAFVDDTGDAVTLGADGYAEDLVVRFTDDDTPSTILAEDQSYNIDFENLADEDAVTITINGVQFSARMGVSPSGTDLDETMGQFLDRFANEINAAMDNDTKAGQVNAVSDGVDTLTFTQVAYNGGETVFMDTPEVEITNGSGGEGGDYWIWDNTDTEVDLFEFDGRDGALDAGSVLFLGGAGMDQGEVTDASMSRSVLATAVEAGETLEGSDAIVVDSIADTDSDAVDFSLHGDDYLIGGSGNDILRGGTGDDRFQGSEGSDEIDGGKDHYVVTTLEAGEQVETVLELNAYEASDDASIVAAMSAQASKNITAGQIVDAEFIDEDGFGLNNGDGYQDTLVYNQNDFSDDAQFTITLDGDIEQQNGGEGTVQVDEGGNGSFEYTSTFTEMEAVRTLSGDGTYAGQGNDTLDVSAVSNAVAATETGDPDAAVIYNMTSDLGVVQINADLNDDDEIDDDNNVNGPDENDAFMAVDGVERFIGGDANEQLNIDESEAKKDNYFDGAGEVTLEDDDDPETTDDPDLVGDSIVYNHTDMDNDGAADDDGNIDNNANGIIENIDFNDAIAVSMRPSIEIVVEDDSETDLVNMTGGSVIGDTVTTDTLVDVETIDVSNAAISAELDDTIVLAGYADYRDGEVRKSEDGDVLVQITGMTEIENIEGSADDDTVQVADDMVNYRAYDNNGDMPLAYDSFLNYDIVADETGARQDLSALDVNDRPEANNQALYTFDLGEGTDRVEYDQESNDIAAVIDFTEGAGSQAVFVMNGDLALDAANDRIDLLQDVEEVVASQGVSVMDFTNADQDLEITFQYDITNADAAHDRLESIIRIADGDGDSIEGLSNYIEYYDMDDDDDVDPFVNATWNQVEGSDYDEEIIYQGSEDLVDEAGLDHRFTDDVLNLRGGDNTVNYHSLETSISVQIALTESDADDEVDMPGDPDVDYTTGSIVATVNFEDGSDAALAGGGTHIISSYTYDNDVSEGFLKLEASQDAEDDFQFTGALDKTYILGTSPGVIDVWLGGDLDGDDLTDATKSMRLTGFEQISDGDSDDTYVFATLNTGLEYTDNAVPADDRDTIAVGNEAIDFEAAPVDTIDLGVLNAEIGIDFDVLDVTDVTDDDVILIGADGAALAYTDDHAEEVILDDLDLFDSIEDFDILTLTEGTKIEGTLEVDVTGGTLSDNENSIDLIDADLNALDFTAMTADVSVEITDATDFAVFAGSGDDEVVGGTGSDIIAGGAGNDELAGGADEVPAQFSVQIAVDLAGAAGGGVIQIDGVDVYTTVAGDGANIIGDAIVDYFTANPAATVAALVPVDVSYAGGDIVFSFDDDTVTDAQIDAAIVENVDDANVNFLNASHDVVYAAEGQGNDIIYGGAGVDVIDGGEGDDIFVVVGEVDNSADLDIDDDYNTGDTAGTAAAIFEAAVEAIEGEAGQAVSDVSTDTFDGGDGVDTIEIWGDVDFTEATISNIEVINLHSTAIFNADQLEGVTINTQADSVVIIEDEVGDDTIFGGDDGQDLSGLQDFVDALDGDDPVDPADLSISDATVAEDGANATFTVTLSEAPGTGEQVTVEYATADGTATDGADYTAASGTLTFDPGVTTQEISVAITDDADGEDDETFTVTLSNATGEIDGTAVTIDDAVATGTITDDDLVDLSISDATVAEDGATATFTVTLSEAPGTGEQVTVEYATADGTATDGADYTAATDTLTFDPGVTTQDISVAITDDADAEGDETFTVTLSNATGSIGGTAVTIDDAVATGTITDDESALPTGTVTVSGDVTANPNVAETFEIPTNAVLDATITDFDADNDLLDIDGATAANIAVDPGVLGDNELDLFYTPDAGATTIDITLTGVALADEAAIAADVSLILV